MSGIERLDNRLLVVRTHPFATFQRPPGTTYTVESYQCLPGPDELRAAELPPTEIQRQ